MSLLHPRTRYSPRRGKRILSQGLAQDLGRGQVLDGTTGKWTLAGRRFGREGNGKHGQPIDRGRILVRTRVRGHLEALQTRCPDLLGDCKIQDSGGTDYAYRLFVEKSAWTEVFHLSLAQRTAAFGQSPACFFSRVKK